MHLSLVPAAAPPRIPPHPAAHVPFPTPTEPTWALPAIARLLGVHMRSAKWQARYVEQLIANAGFPRPLPMMKGEGLTHGILPRRSRWMPAGVTAWLGDQIPAEAAEALDSQAATEAADRLDAAAENLFGGDAA
ncbi:hypothetical protein [Sphingobium sp. YG1]|uniref:hypothetical protein n=1 Tax=Sphingobium sp. YG1 TaxID=2082188 RepID=UPI000DBB97D6|nr:hypothetical protein [Sphingobium sp. YG1]BBC99118.1 hypothetical protein YGS_C1P0374 [Sphingobium sp. YG1]